MKQFYLLMIGLVLAVSGWAQTIPTANLYIDCRKLTLVHTLNYSIDSVSMGSAGRDVAKVAIPAGVSKVHVQLESAEYTVPVVSYSNNQLVTKSKTVPAKSQSWTLTISAIAGADYCIDISPVLNQCVLLDEVSGDKKLKKIQKKYGSMAASDSYIAQLPETHPAFQNAHPAMQAPKPIERILSDVDKNIPITNNKSENTFVLIIANEDYQFVDDVEFALNDGKAFKEYCVKTLGVPERQVWLYENASYGMINAGVSKMVQAMDFFDNPNAIIYYCGHGIPDEKTSSAYIIPTDGNGKDMATCYSLNHLYTTLANTKAEKVTYFMDACFTGANKEGSMLVAARGVAVAPKKVELSGKTIVFSATSADETAMAYKEKQHGLFTYFLLKKLQETEGNVSYAELYEYINRNVKRESFLTNEKPQTPVVATSPSLQDVWQKMTFK